MAVVGTAKERWEGRTASYDGGMWTYTREWLVQTDNKNDRENTVSGASGLPAYGDTHPGAIADAAYATKISYNQKTETPFAWIVLVTYTSERAKSSDDPASDEILVTWTTEIYQRPVFQDIFGNGILNSAGDYFIDPTPVADDVHLIGNIKANVAAVPTWIVDFQNSVNAAQITVGGLPIAAGLAKVQRIDIGERQKRNNSTFYPLTIEIHVHKEGWTFQPMDVGFRTTTPDTTGRVKPTREQAKNDGDQSEPTTPILLDGFGNALTDPTPSRAVFLNFQLYALKDFSVLPGIS